MTSRMALIMSVVHYHQLNIDPYEKLTGDKAFYDGHYYSDKAIGTAMLGVPLYAILSELRGFDEHFYSELPGGMANALYPITVMVVALPSALLSVLLYQLVRLVGDNHLWALILSLSYSFGTLAFPFSSMLFGHQVAAAFAFAAFFVLVKVRLRTTSCSAWLMLLAGVLAGLAVLMEYQVALIAALLFLYATTFVRPKRRLMLFVLGGVPAAALVLAYNWYTLDSPLSFAYSYVSTPGFAGMHKGLFGMTQPRWSSFIEITLGARGLLTQSIFLWLLPFGIWQMSRTARWRRECALCAGIGLAFVVWNSAYYMPLGGWSPGARFLVPSLPFLMVPLAFLARLPRPYALLTRSVLLLASVWSMGLYLLICATDPKAPSSLADPVREYWLNRLAHGELVPNLGMLVFGLRGVESLVPLAVVFVVALAALALLSRDFNRMPRTRG